jgi:hypothetical protein
MHAATAPLHGLGNVDRRHLTHLTATMDGGLRQWSREAFTARTRGRCPRRVLRHRSAAACHAGHGRARYGAVSRPRCAWRHFAFLRLRRWNWRGDWAVVLLATVHPHRRRDSRSTVHRRRLLRRNGCATAMGRRVGNSGSLGVGGGCALVRRDRCCFRVHRPRSGGVG